MTDAVGTIKNITGEKRVVPSLGGRLVDVGQVVEVPLALVTSFTQAETSWTPVNKAAVAAHQAMLDGLAELLGSSEPTPDTDGDADGPRTNDTPSEG